MLFFHKNTKIFDFSKKKTNNLIYSRLVFLRLRFRKIFSKIIQFYHCWKNVTGIFESTHFYGHLENVQRMYPERAFIIFTLQFDLFFPFVDSHVTQFKISVYLALEHSGSYSRIVSILGIQCMRAVWNCPPDLSVNSHLPFST